MSNQVNGAGSACQEHTQPRNWSIIIGRVALVWALVEALMAGLANLSGGSLLGVSEQHFSLHAIVAALVDIGLVTDGSALRLARRG